MMNDENVMVTEEKKGMTTGQKVLAVGGAVLAGVIGYKYGRLVEGAIIESGLQNMCKADPTFRDHFMKANGMALKMLGREAN